MCKKKPHIYNSCPAAGEEGPTRRARVVYVGFFIRSSSTPPSFQLMLLLLCRPWYSRGNLAQSNFTSLRKLLEGSTGYFLHMWDIHWVESNFSFILLVAIMQTKHNIHERKWRGHKKALFFRDLWQLNKMSFGGRRGCCGCFPFGYPMI